MSQEISVHARTKQGSICKFLIDIHDEQPGPQLDLFGVEPFTFDDARAALADHLIETEQFRPRVVLACLPGGKK